MIAPRLSVRGFAMYAFLAVWVLGPIAVPRLLARAVDREIPAQHVGMVTYRAVSSISSNAILLYDAAPAVNRYAYSSGLILSTTVAR